MSERWDKYFLRIAREVASKANCSSRKIGSVLIQDNSVVATGMNGTPRGIDHCSDRPLSYFVELDREVIGKNEMNDCVFINANIDNPVGGCPRKVLGYPSGKGLHLCAAVHGEVNSIITSARHGIETVGGTLYCSCGIPCKDCMKMVINAGIKRIVCIDRTEEEEQYGYNLYTRKLLEESGIELTVYKEEEINE